MTIEYSPRNTGSDSIAIFKSPERRTVASYERELTRHRRTEIGLREALRKGRIDPTTDGFGTGV